MARVTVEDCIDKVENRFELVLLASHRARLISSGAPLTIDRDRDKNPVVALREIADETIAPDDLKEQLIHSLQKYVEVDEPEAETVPLLSQIAAAPTPAPMAAATGSTDDPSHLRPHERGRPPARPRGPRPAGRERRRGLTPAHPADLRKPGSAGLFCAHSPRFARRFTLRSSGAGQYP